MLRILELKLRGVIIITRESTHDFTYYYKLAVEKDRDSIFTTIRSYGNQAYGCTGNGFKAR
jgi:hypothetical protein